MAIKRLRTKKNVGVDLDFKYDTDKNTLTIYDDAGLKGNGLEIPLAGGGSAGVSSLNRMTNDIRITSPDGSLTIANNGEGTTDQQIQLSINGPADDVEWGNITGTISNQVDLQAEFDTKLNLKSVGQNRTQTITNNNGVISINGGNSQNNEEAVLIQDTASGTIGHYNTNTMTDGCYLQISTSQGILVQNLDYSPYIANSAAGVVSKKLLDDTVDNLPKVVDYTFADTTDGGAVQKDGTLLFQHIDKGSTQVQSDMMETNINSPAFIKNKDDGKEGNTLGTGDYQDERTEINSGIYQTGGPELIMLMDWQNRDGFNSDITIEMPNYLPQQPTSIATKGYVDSVIPTVPKYYEHNIHLGGPEASGGNNSYRVSFTMVNQSPDPVRLLSVGGLLQLQGFNDETTIKSASGAAIINSVSYPVIGVSSVSYDDQLCVQLYGYEGANQDAGIVLPDQSFSYCTDVVVEVA